MLRTAVLLPLLGALALSSPLSHAESRVAVSSDEPVTIHITKPHPQPRILPHPHPGPGDAPFVGVRPTVDVAILLDTSNSMDGLIHQAKAQLWTIVQQFAKAKKHGQTPSLRVALFEYGNTSLPASEGYLRQVVPLTDDLDVLSEALFSLSTNGGDEYCGQVIDEALTRLEWSDEPGGYKAIFIAGNEPFTQGTVDYRDSCKRAIEQGVVVNTIHCGAYDAGIDGSWEDGAALAEGEYFNIDQDRAVVHIECPQDKLIIELNAKLNQTYLFYGERHEALARNQMAQDSNAMSLGVAVMAERAATKASAGYSNLGRDLVDSYAADVDILSELDDEALPDSMKGLSEDERVAKIEAAGEERKALQAQIQALQTEREAYLAAERAKRSDEAGAASLGDAVVAAIQQQLREAGYSTP